MDRMKEGAGRNKAMVTMSSSDIQLNQGKEWRPNSYQELYWIVQTLKLKATARKGEWLEHFWNKNSTIDCSVML